MSSEPFEIYSPAVFRTDLAALGLVDADPEQAFDNLTDLALHALMAKASMISIVQPDRNRQYFKSQMGLPEPWATRRETPLSHSFCQHVCASNANLVVPDARLDDRVKTNPAIADLGVIAYLGVPIHGPANDPIGAICVIEGQPRHWSDADVGTMEKLANCVSDQILLRALLQRSYDRLQSEQRHPALMV